MKLITWLINKRKYDIERIEEDNQYNKLLTKYGKLKKNDEQKDKTIENLTKIKDMYCKNCKNLQEKNKNLRKEIKELREKFERERSLRLSMSKPSR